MAERHGVTLSQVVLAWLLSGSPQARPIVGVSSLDQLDAALAASRLELSPEELSTLDEPR